MNVCSGTIRFFSIVFYRFLDCLKSRTFLWGLIYTVDTKNVGGGDYHTTREIRCNRCKKLEVSSSDTDKIETLIYLLDSLNRKKIALASSEKAKFNRLIV